LQGVSPYVVSMKTLLVAFALVGSFGVAHAQMPEPSPAEAPPPVIETPPTAEPPADNAEAPLVRPPSSYASQPDRDRSDEYDETPPISGGRLVGEALIGGVFSVGGAIGGAYVGYSVETQDGCHQELCGLGGAIVGGIAGLAFVTPLGVYMVGSADGQTGSFAATLGGSLVGTLAGIVAVGASEGEDGSLVLLVAGPVVGSMIGFNLTRKYDEGHKRRNWAPVASVTHGNTTFGLVGQF
jgi:hypothetical protein